MTRGLRSTCTGLLLALLWTAACPSLASATDPQPLLAEAIEAYEEAQAAQTRDRRIQGFRRAQRLFASAADQTPNSSAELQINLGNAALQAEHLGAAILAYRRALLLDPGLERAHQNLGYARTLLPGWVPTPESGGVLDTFFFWHRTMSRSDRQMAAALCFLVACVLAAAAWLRRSASMATVAGLPLMAWLAMVGSLGLDPAREAGREGVIVADEATARAADSINAPLLFGDPLPAGAEVEIIEDRGRWMQIRLPNGRTAWLDAVTIERIAPSR